MRAVWCALVVVTAACGDNFQGNISIETPDAWAGAVGEFVALTPARGLSLGTGGALRIRVTDDAAIPAEGYAVAPDGAGRWIVHAHDVLGAQYGVAAALENLGFRWRHPYEIYAPAEPTDRGQEIGQVHVPQIRVRGLHIHTLHPIEGYFALWEPSAGSTSDAHRIIDWIIKNRGNYIQWAGLDDILKPDRYALWKPFTQELIAYAHARGVGIGLDIELFGQSNLQNAYDLSDDQTGMVPISQEVAARLPPITQDLPFDVYDLSFGEFFDAQPQKLIDAINEVAAQLRTFAPQAEMHALVHVGATQRVTYMGMDMIYYFLVKYADPSVVPDIHSVMYYDLFEDAGGAYQHTDFSEHRQYLEDRMCAGQKAAYHPEDAYWVAFDNSVPMFDPVYVHSRFVDLDGLARTGCALDEHLIFSSGWEWGYWLNDVTSLRASYELPGAAQDGIVDAYAPDLGADAAAIVDRLATAQHDALMTQHLAGYMAGRDAVIDAGRVLHIVSQPDRITFDQLTPAMIDSFTATVLGPLQDHITALAKIEHDFARLDLPDNRWAREIRDGIHIDLLRAEFVLHSYDAVIDHLNGTSGRHLQLAEQVLAEAKATVVDHDGDLHDTHGRRLIDKTTNQTTYQFGYLYMADTLCYWNRELAQVKNLLGDTSVIPPACVF
ncbi:MAG: hypothetical protein JO257_36055 [Deltaproteobacteria bacterium]|nr:hypothetical protein [Deltaproteobacteria bacterium]